MLKPKYIERLPDRLIELYSQIEMDILEDMARRIAAYDHFIPAAQWQYQKLIEMGNFHSYILEALSALTGRTHKELETLMEEAGQKALAFDDRVYRKAGLDPPPLAASPALQEVLEAGIRSTGGLFENLTRTTANTSTRQFERALDRTWLQISTGAFDYNTAIRSAVKELAARGVEAVSYPTGHTDTLEVAVRRATVTGVNQMALKLQEARAQEMGSDLVETTAHSGARPSHAEWQGKVFSRSGTHPKYPPFVESTGYGTGAGLGGWNCRHSFFPFFEGISEPAYSSEELREMDAPRYAYNGQQLTEYEASQRQRHIESNIRRWKREYKAMEAAGQPTEEAAAKLAKWQHTQKDFLEQTGLKRQYERENVEGFGRSEAARARVIAKAEVEKYSRIRYNQDGTIRATDNWTEKAHPRLPAQYRSNAVVDTVSQGGLQRDRMIYDTAGLQKLQINAGPHGNPKKHPYGESGEHAHDIIWEEGKIASRYPRELTDQERKENADIL